MRTMPRVSMARTHFEAQEPDRAAARHAVWWKQKGDGQT
jgi:hypothetical protein